jgi:DNA-binding transcriptional ArsR family regulator
MQDAFAKVLVVCCLHVCFLSSAGGRLGSDDILIGLSDSRKIKSIGETDMSWSLDAIAAFSTAAELGSFSAAARRLGKSQSTISEAIANLEIDLGVSLFERSGRQPVLTQAGQQLLSHARQLLDAGDALSRVAGLLGAGWSHGSPLCCPIPSSPNRWSRCCGCLSSNFPHWSWKRWWQKKKT